ncbi:ubiquitin carboxyl-terminal hydrolase, partial [Trifolium pratense]
RYGHLSFKGLNTLVKKKMVEGLPQLNDEQNTCKHCLTGKQHREPIPKSANLESYQAA